MSKNTLYGINCKDLYYSFPGFVYFIYLLFPFRIWDSFVFPNQSEITIVSLPFACLMLFLFTFKESATSAFHFNKTDLLAVLYGIYILLRSQYPLEKEWFFQVFSIACIYVYFHRFPEGFLRPLMMLIPVAGIVQAVWSVSRFTQPWQDLSDITGIFGNTGLFGGFTALGFVACVGILFFPGLGGGRYFRFVAAGFPAIVLATLTSSSGSRASWVAALGAILFLLYRFVCSRGFRWKTLSHGRWFFRLLIPCLLVSFLFAFIRLYEMKPESADGRLLVARVSLGMVEDAPLFGSGIGGFQANYMNYQAAYFEANPGSHYRMLADEVLTPFNEYLKILTEQGIAGLLLFAALLYCLFRKKDTGEATVVQASALFILLFGLFSYPFDRLPFTILFISFLAVASSGSAPVFTLHPEKVKRLRLPLLAALCIISAIVCSSGWRYAGHAQAWNRALVDFPSAPGQSLSELGRLYPELVGNPVFLTTYGKALGFGGHSREAVGILEESVARHPLYASYIELGKCHEQAGQASRAHACWSRAALMIPSRFRPGYLSMKLHFKNKEYDRAQEYARQLLLKEIKIDNPEIDRMKEEARDIVDYRPPP